MLTLDDLKLYYERGYIELRIDLYREGIPNQPEGLTRKQVEAVLATKKISITVYGKKTVIDVTKEGHFAVSIGRENVKRSQWEKIKKQMRESGFSYRSESPWFCVYENGKWN
jgi:hypothetical protein